MTFHVKQKHQKINLKLKKPMKKIISGIQPSGRPSLGNYLGAIKPQVSMQNEADVTYFIADLHAITVRQNPTDLKRRTFEVAAWYLACGLNPEKATLFVQSHVPAHAQLGWILNTFTGMGELERMTQFKDKSSRHNQNINVGLFSYPVLQAADILLHDINAVPVGEDQKQHIELTRDIAIRFNNHYTQGKEGAKPVFVVPETMLPKAGARVRDLQHPENKMSKSIDGKGTIFMEEDINSISKKIKSAVTDSYTDIRYDKIQKAGISNLLEIYAVTQNISIAEAEKEFSAQQYGAFKQAVADAVVAKIEPIQTEFKNLMLDKQELSRILKQGADKANLQAERTLEKVMKKIGFVPPSHEKL
jgi:tryptophanyl-tRNA synthetase